MYRRGLFALSADPVHNGHLDIIKKASEQCDTLIIYVTFNDQKKGAYLLSVRARRRLIKAAIGGWLPNTTVITGDALLTDVFMEQGCDVLIRGIRNKTDLEYEKGQVAYHDKFLPGISDKTLYLEGDPQFAGISSSLIKSFAFHHIDVSPMVPLMAKAALEATLHKQCVIGITGQMATGKSWVAEKIVEATSLSGYPAFHLNFDDLVRELYDEDTPGAQIVRDEIDKLFPGVLIEDGKKVDRAKLKAQIVKAEQDKLDAVHDLTKPHVFRLYRKHIKGKEGLILVEWAQLIENGLAPFVNNRVIIVDSPDLAAMLAKRGVPADLVARFDRVQWDADKKALALETEIRAAGYGRVIRVTNRIGKPLDEMTELLSQLQGMAPKLDKGVKA